MNAWPFPSRDACGRALFADLAGGGGAIETGKQGRKLAAASRASRTISSRPGATSSARRRVRAAGAYRAGASRSWNDASEDIAPGLGRDGGARGSERVRVARSRRRGEASSSRATFGTAPGGASDPLEDFRVHRVLPSNKHVEIFLSLFRDTGGCKTRGESPAGGQTL